jgi:transposase
VTITKFNEETCKCLVDNYSKGLTITDCANIAGIDRRTVHRWIEKGEKARSGKYKQFYLEMQKAKSKFKEHHLRKIAEAKDWRASQYLLQVTDSETYVVTEKKQVNADVKTDLLEKLQRPLPELKEDD